jgi:hypothetical protein
VRRADNLTAICEPIDYTMWDPQHLTTVQASITCYRDSFVLLVILIIIILCVVCFVWAWCGMCIFVCCVVLSVLCCVVLCCVGYYNRTYSSYYSYYYSSCGVFCLGVVWYVYFCVLCPIAVPRPPGGNLFAVQLNNHAGTVFV